jgi:hypothetical protein
VTAEELAGLGLDDAALRRGFREAYGFVPPLLAGNAPLAASRRREVFDRLLLSWYAPSTPRPPERPRRA